MMNTHREIKPHQRKISLNNYFLFYRNQTIMTITNQPINISQRQLWLAAIKPPMYTVAIIPITFGAGLAYYETRSFDGVILTFFLFSALAIIAWLNLTNDVFDADTGIDVNKAHSVVNLTGKKNLVFWIANIFLLLGLGGIFLINWWQQDITVFLIILASCFLGYTYQGPPFRLGYQGLGELICLPTFGPMAVGSSYYSQTQSFSTNSLLISSLIGLSTAIILFCSHFHQVEDDLKAGKKSPIVRLGTVKGAMVLMVSVIVFYLLLSLFCLLGMLPLTCLGVFVTLPVAYQLVNHVNQYHAQPEKVKNCKFIAVNLHFLTGMVMGAGLFLG